MKIKSLKLVFFVLVLSLALGACKAEYDDTAQVGEDFLEANKANSDVNVTASGLQYKVINDNPYGIYPRLTGFVYVYYKSYFIDGSPCKKSYTDTASVAYLQQNAGLQEAIRKMRIGSKWRIWIPSNLAYGSDGLKDTDGSYIVDPNTVLMYDIELLGEQ